MRPLEDSDFEFRDEYEASMDQKFVMSHERFKRELAKGQLKQILQKCPPLCSLD